MKKLFISVPMKGRTEENIKNSMDRMHKIAELIFDQELEVIPTYIQEGAPDSGNSHIWYLGEAIKKMYEADYFIGIGHSGAFTGCNVEVEVARYHNIPYTLIDMDKVMPDAAAIDLAYWNELAEETK